MPFARSRIAIPIFALAAFACVFFLAVFFSPFPSPTAYAETPSEYSVSLPAENIFTYDGRERTVAPTIVGFSQTAEYVWTKNDKIIPVKTPFIKVKTVSDSGKYVVTVKENGAEATAAVTVKIRPKLIKAKIRSFVCFYGDVPTEPEYKLISSPAFGDVESDIGFYVEPFVSSDAGTYSLRAFCRNENYYTDATGTVNVLKRAVTVSADFPSVALLTRGETLKFTFTAHGLLPSSDAQITVLYHKLNDRGVPGDGSENITNSGKYVLTASFTKPQNNYELSLDSASREITVYPRESQQNGIEIFLEKGFIPGVKSVVSSLDKYDYARRYEKPLDLQYVYDAFAVEIANSDSVKMEVRVPVIDYKSYYTVALADENGHLVYLPCTVKDGYASFVVGTENTVFILWKDKDETPYAIVCLLLAFLLIVLVLIFIRQYKKLRLLKFSAYSVLPIFGINFAFRGSVYFFAFLSISLGIACVVFAVAVCVVNRRIRFLRKKGV